MQCFLNDLGRIGRGFFRRAGELLRDALEIAERPPQDFDLFISKRFAAARASTSFLRASRIAWTSKPGSLYC
jgi:hypothetical protein